MQTIGKGSKRCYIIPPTVPDLTCSFGFANSTGKRKFWTGRSSTARLLFFRTLWYNNNVKLDIFEPKIGGLIMRYGTKVITIGLLIVLMATGGAFAVGYERYNAEAPSDARIKGKANGSHDFCEAVKKASFVEKAPAVLDEVAAFIKDLLAQFGLKGNGAR
jgi:hypothetical protein